MSTSELPVSEIIKARPVFARFMERMAFMPLEPPSEEERRDAIKVLRELYPPMLEVDEVLLAEAERIFIESDVQYLAPPLPPRGRG